MSKIALVTGTSTGIGLSTAIALSKAGFTTIATMRDLDKSRVLAERAQSEGVTLHLKQLDVCDQASVDACVGQTIAQHGRIDLLVNNAGAGMMSTIEQLSLDEVKRCMDVNFYGVWRVTQAVLPHMRVLRSGRIITVSSLNGVVGLPFNDAYCAAKFAVEGAMECLAPVISEFGIHVSLVEPGPVRTEFFSTDSAQRAAIKSDAADPYKPLLDVYVGKRSQRNAGNAQTGDDVAKVILEAATAESPHLRYQTSDMARAVVAQVRVDPTGDSILKQLRSQLKA